MLINNNNYNLINGNIITLNNISPIASSVTISNGKIESIDSVNKKYPSINLNGLTVLPGLVDSHFHLSNFGKRLEMINLKTMNSIDEVVNEISKKVKEVGPGVFIHGFGWDQTRWDNQDFPSIEALNYFSDNPVVLTRIDGHAIWTNQAAITLSNYDDNLISPDGGEIINGCILIDNAMNNIRDIIPKNNKNDVKRWIKTACNEAIKWGITNVHDAWQDPTIFESINDLSNKDELPIRCYGMIGASYLELISEILNNGFHTNSNYMVRSVKAFIDGALGSRGAALLEPYTDCPNSCGLILISHDEFIKIASKCADTNFQLCTHAIGDKGNKMVIDVYSKYYKENYRWRIEHAQMIKYDDMLRCKEYQIIPSMQPSHCTSDMRWMKDRIGSHRTHRISRWKTFEDLGLPIPGGSDCPIEDGNPLFEYYAAITRQDHQGFPENGWHPEEALSRKSALKMFTQWAAYGEFSENRRGMIKENYDADLTVMDKDIIACEPHEILETNIMITIVGGRAVYSQL